MVGTISTVMRLGRSMGALLAGVLVFHVGWYILLPFFAVLFTSRRGITPAQAGLLLAVQSFTLLAGSLVGGWLADRLGRRAAMVVGLLARAAGLWGLGFFTGMPALLGTVAVAGLGGGVYGPAAKAGIAALATAENRPAAFAARGIAANIGVSLGPLLGGLLLRGSMPLLFGVAAALHAGLAVMTWVLYREPQKVEEGPEDSVLTVLGDRRYMAFSLVTVLAWALFAQLSIAVPLYARHVLGLESSIGLLWTATSLTVICVQFAVTRYATAHLSTMTAMGLGAALLGAGLGLVSLVSSFPGLLAAVLVFIVGEMLVMPTSDAAVSIFATRKALGSYFGIATVAWGLGEGLGNLAGGSLMQYALTTGTHWLPWTLYAAGGIAVGGLYLLLGRRRPQPQAHAAHIGLFRPGQPSPHIQAGARSVGEGCHILLNQDPSPDGRKEDE